MNSIHLICLGVQDIPTSRTFYQAIGFIAQKKTQSAELVFFNNHGTKLELFLFSELLKDIGLDPKGNPAPASFNGTTLAFNTKSKAEADLTMAKALENGATLVKPLTWGEWGGYSGYFRDLNGYYWEIAYADSWRFDDQDMLIID